MIVPGRGKRHRRLAKAAEPVRGRLHRVGVAQFAQVLRFNVAVDVVAQEDEELEVVLEDRVEDRLRQVLLEAGAEADALQGGFDRRGVGSRRLFSGRAAGCRQQCRRQQRKPCRPARPLLSPPTHYTPPRS